jgi:antitoxin (DNA-binding transcriptional repressor) of toxin-antitoxin stability system
VVAGETIKVTDRGRPVARIVPLRDETWWDQMIGDGRVIPATRDIIQVLEESPPPPLMPGERSPFEVLMELREGER